jgi:hypothetical protein
MDRTRANEEEDNNGRELDAVLLLGRADDAFRWANDMKQVALMAVGPPGRVRLRDVPLDVNDYLERYRVYDF